MEYSRRLSRTRLHLVGLESRVQPGSLFATGLDFGVATEVIARPESHASRARIKLQETQEIHVVGDVAENHITPTCAVTAPTKTESTRVSNDLGMNDARKSMTNNLAMSAPKVRNASQAPSIAEVLQNRAEHIRTAPVSAVATDRTAVAFEGTVDHRFADAADFQAETCGEGFGTKGLTNLNYTDGGMSTARTNHVAAGRGALNIGAAFSAGSRGNSGVVSRYSTNLGTGNDCAVFTYTDGAGDPVRFNAVYTTATAVVAVGTIDRPAAGTDEAIIARLDPVTLIPNNTAGAPVIYSQPGADLNLEGVGTRPQEANQQVVFNGSLFDISTTTSFVWGARWDQNLDNEVAQFSWTYLDIDTETTVVDCWGTGIDPDRGGNTYHSITCDETDFGTGNLTNVTARLDSNDVSLRWGVTLWDNVAFTNFPGQGNFDARVLGGASSSSGLRTVGGYHLSAQNPGFIASLNIKWTDLSNPNGPAFSGSIFWVAGFDFVANDVAIERDGTQFTAGMFGVPGNHAAVLDQYADGFLAFEDEAELDAFGTDERGTGVDLVAGAPGSDMIFGGNTAGNLGTGSGWTCDKTFNGGLDGFVSRFSQPIS